MRCAHLNRQPLSPDEQSSGLFFGRRKTGQQSCGIFQQAQRLVGAVLANRFDCRYAAYSTVSSLPVCTLAGD